MQNNKDILHIISNETKHSIDQISVVTPSIYASIFSKFASQHNTIIDDEQELSNKLIIEECSKLTNLQIQSSKSAKILSINTNKAITAIKEKDAVLLNEVLKETQSLRDEVEKLKKAVYKDELTHLYNRKWLHDNLLDFDTDNLKIDGTLAILDLNYFKIINDTYGHIVGDKVLIYIANKLKKTRHKVVRYGGDEFIIIFNKNISLEQAKSELDILREDILGKKLKAQDDFFKVSFSFGLCEFKKCDDLNDIIELSDKIMYEDKIQIKKRVTGI